MNGTLFAVKGNPKAAPLTAKAVPGVRSRVADMPSAWPGRAVAEELKARTGPKPISLIGSTGSIGTQVGFMHCEKRSISALECNFFLVPLKIFHNTTTMGC